MQNCNTVLSLNHFKQIEVTMELKKKDFIKKASSYIRAKDCMGVDAFWSSVTRDSEGRMLGWVLGFSPCDEDQVVLATNKGNVRVFKTTEAVVRFVSDANMVCAGGSVMSLRLDFA